LRCVVEETGELELHGFGQEGSVGSYGLAYFDVETAVGGEEVVDTFGDALVQLGDLFGFLGGEVEFVVYGDHGALIKSEW
jgi:hypothetical protein